MKVVNRLEDLAPEYPAPVVTIGNFDGVHLGHQSLMRDLVERAAELGGTPTVITFYPHPLQVLAPNNAPLQIQTLDQKIETIGSFGIELLVVIPFNTELAQTSAIDFATKILWDRLHPKEIYVGPNFAFGHRRQGSFSLLKEIGEEKGFLAAKIHQVQFRGNRVSSTAVRQALLSGQIGLARRLLGRPFALKGVVTRGSGLGTRLGIPTANLHTPNELIPRRGVYVTFFSVEGRRHKAVTNIGFRPTVNPDVSSLSIETHLLDFNQDIYGKEGVLEFLVRLRDERRFSGSEDLVAHIRSDKENALRYFRWLDRKCGSGGD
ncbi:MAG: bifunctional riboflavin kinase/FAD synthetase [Acidobacteria bacterium]|nr:bifunctional riboflavin kinase/FAD synthetase [Acidobacteriota bacterium]